MRQLVWKSGVTREDNIKNELIRGSTYEWLRQSLIVDNMLENRLKWLVHVLRRDETVAVRLVKEMYVEGTKGRIPKMSDWI